MAETLSTLSIISYIIAGVCLLLAILFWFVFKIPSVIGDLSGRTAKKSIAKMRVANEKSGAKSYRESSVNAERGRLTETMPVPLKQQVVNAPTPAYSPVAVNTQPQQRPETSLLSNNRAETYDSQATAVLNNGETALLTNEESTVLLAATEQQPVRRQGGKKLVMIDDIMLIHTNEVIG